MDLVVYTQDKHLLFIQVSKSEYARHESKRDDLFNNILYTEDEKDITIMEHYCILASKPVLTNKQNQKSWTKNQIAYFYITTSDQKNSRDNVNILSEKNYLHKLNGWDVLRQYFKSIKNKI